MPIITTVSGAKATATALKGLKSGPLEQVPLQDYFPEVSFGLACMQQRVTGWSETPGGLSMCAFSLHVRGVFVVSHGQPALRSDRLSIVQAAERSNVEFKL